MLKEQENKKVLINSDNIIFQQPSSDNKIHMARLRWIESSGSGWGTNMYFHFLTAETQYTSGSIVSVYSVKLRAGNVVTKHISLIKLKYNDDI